MAQPITWQNVNGPNYAGISSALQAAQGGIAGAFTGIQDVLKERAALEATNAVAVKQNNTQEYLNRIAQFKSPEQLQAAIADGSLEQARAAYGTNIDQAATRNAAEAMLGDRYKQAMAATEFGNTMLNEKTAPIMDQFRQAAIRGDEAGKEAARTAYSAAGGKHGYDLEQFAQTTSRDNLKWSETQKTWVRDEQKFKADIQHMKNQDATAAAQVAIAGRNAAVNEADSQLRAEEMGFRRNDRAEDRVTKINSALGELGSRNAASAAGTETIFKAISANIKDPATQENARVALGEMFAEDAKKATQARLHPKKDKDGNVIEHIPLTTAAAMAAVLSMDKTGWLSFRSTGRDAAADRAFTAMESVSAADQAKSSAAGEAVLREQLSRARSKVISDSTPTTVSNPFAGGDPVKTVVTLPASGKLGDTRVMNGIQFTWTKDGWTRTDTIKKK